MADPKGTDKSSLRVPLEALDDPEFRHELEDLSMEWFGTKHRLTVCLVLRHSEQILPRPDLITLSGVSQGGVSREAAFLASQGLITSYQPERTIFHERLKHPFWKLFDELVESRTSWLTVHSE
jgi:hypothetical protein